MFYWLDILIAYEDRRPYMGFTLNQLTRRAKKKNARICGRSGTRRGGMIILLRRAAEQSAYQRERC